METNRVIMHLIFVFCIVSFVPSTVLSLRDAGNDTYWQKRAEAARAHVLKDYQDDPYQSVDRFFESSIVDSNETDVKSITDAKSSITNLEFSEGSNNTRRTLRGRGNWKKMRGPCRAINPIDKCWRCQANWALNRKKLADCVRGFAHNTIGGKNGKIYVVTDNSDADVMNPKKGTLRHAVIQKEPLWIIFDHDMNIKLSQELMINDDKTIDARGANVHIAYGAGITIQYVTNIIIHGLKVHHIVPGKGGMIRDSVDHAGFRGVADADGISVFGSSRVWLDHISMSRCQDGLIDVIQGSTAITISNCHFTHHNDVMLLGASNTYSGDSIMQVTVAYNHFGKGLVQRMPRVRWGFVHVVNNDYTHWELYAIGGSQHPTILSQGNRFIAPPNLPYSKEVTKRDYAQQSEWKHWIWKSEGDLLMNGAFFVQSGDPQFKHRFSRLDMIKAKNGYAAAMLTRYAGSLQCKVGSPC